METEEIMNLLKDPKELVGALYGTLLGDSSVTKPSPGNSRLTFGQSNGEYANWKFSIFTSLRFTKPVLYNTTWQSQTPRLPMFTKLYTQMYHNGRKTIPEHSMKSITPLGLALLYFDDGDFHTKKQEVKLATMSFNKAEHLLMQKGFFKRFGLRFNIHTRKSYGGNRQESYYYFRMKQSDRIKFFELIEPFKPECMSYKFPTAEGMEKILTKSRMSVTDIDDVLDDGLLFKLYYINQMTLTEISHETGLNTGTISGRVDKLNTRINNCLH